MSELVSQRITLDTFSVCTTPKVLYKDLNIRRYNLPFFARVAVSEMTRESNL